MDPRIRCACDGDEIALGELLVEQHDRLRALIAGKISAALEVKIDAESVLQETFVAAFRSIGSFQPKSDRAFAHWLDSIAEHRLLDAIRRQRTQKRGGGAAFASAVVAGSEASAVQLLDLVSGPIPTPSRQLAQQEGLAALRVHLAQLPDDQRQAVELRHLQGLSREEVAARLGRGVDEVRGLLYRGLKNLRDALGNSSLYLLKK